MNYKKIALVLLLLPAVNYGNAAESRIKELEEAQTKKSIEVLEISNLVVQRATSYLTKRRDILKFWEPKKEDSFGEFLNEFSDTFYSGMDVDALIEESPLKVEDYDDLKFSLIRIAVEKHLYKQAVLKYEELVDELTDINIKLNA